MKWVYLHSVRERVIKVSGLSVRVRLTDGSSYGFFLLFVVILYADHPVGNEKPGSHFIMNFEKEPRSLKFGQICPLEI